MSVAKVLSRRQLLLTLTAATLPVAAIAQDTPSTDPVARQRAMLEEFVLQARSSNLIETLRQIPSASIFADLLVRTGLDAQLGAMPDITVFVPINQAWEQPGARASVASMPAATALVQQHVVPVRWDGVAGQVLDARSLNGKAIRAVDGAVNGIDITLQGIRTSNGWIHLVGRFIA